MKHLTIFVLLCLFIIKGNTQTITVEGIVTDNTGVPLIGIQVQVVGRKPIATLTNWDGKYAIETSPDGKLTFSAPGYKSKKEKVEKRQTIDIEMEETYELDPSCLGIPENYHSISILATYVNQSDKLGYGINYQVDRSYFMPCNIKQKILNLLTPGISLKNINPSDNKFILRPILTVKPLSLPLFRRKYRTIFLYPYLDGGYYFDTDFKRLEQHGFSYGVGMNIYLRTFAPYGRNLYLTTGYSFLANQHLNNHFYIGLKFNLTWNKGYVII